MTFNILNNNKSSTLYILLANCTKKENLVTIVPNINLRYYKCLNSNKIYYTYQF